MAERNLVHGLHALRWLLQRHPERVRQLWLQSGREDARAREISRKVHEHLHRALVGVMQVLERDAERLRARRVPQETRHGLEEAESLFFGAG